MLYKCRGKILLNNYFCKGWKIKPILFFLVLLNTYIFTKCVHLVLCGYTTEFSLRWDPLTENPYKNSIKVGFNQLCGAQKSKEKQESLEDIHSSNAAESPLPRQAMFWEMYTHTRFLGQSWATGHSWSRDLRLLNPAAQGQFFHFSFYISEGNQSGASILTLNSALLEATRVGGTSLHPQCTGLWQNLQTAAARQRTHCLCTPQPQGCHSWKAPTTPMFSFVWH